MTSQTVTSRIHWGGVLDYVVEAQTFEDGSWYRKYKSGWLEQGGSFEQTTTTIDANHVLVTFIKPFTTNVLVVGGFTKSTNQAVFGQYLFQSGTTTLTTMVCSLVAYNMNGAIQHDLSIGTGFWYASGY